MKTLPQNERFTKTLLWFCFAEGYVEGEDEEDDEEGEVMDEEELYKEAQQKLEQEKESIMANKNMIAEVRKYLI